MLYNYNNILQVIIWDINASAGEAVIEEIKERGGSASYYTCDLSNSDSIYQTAAKVSPPWINYLMVL